MITVKLSKGIMMVLELDSPEVRGYYPIETRETKNHVYVTGAPEAMRKLVSDCEYRRDMGAFDQPLSWARSAKAASDRISRALRVLTCKNQFCRQQWRAGELNKVMNKDLGYATHRCNACGGRCAP